MTTHQGDSERDSGGLRGRFRSISESVGIVNDLPATVRTMQAHLEVLTEQTDQIRGELAPMSNHLQLDDARINELASRADHASGLLDSHNDRLDDLAGRFDVLRADTDAINARLSEAAHRLEALQHSVDALTAALTARPYMARPELLDGGTATGDAAVAKLGYDVLPAETDPYVLFESVFRGSEDFTRDRQRSYLDIIGTGRFIVDVGCGRGEVLDLLREAGLSALGIDSDPGMVRRCRDKGHDVVEADALRWLAEQPDESVDVVFSAQVIEHLPYAQLLEFLASSRRVLRPNGLFIAETPNPHALSAWKTFWTDLSHERPIFPETLLVLCMGARFDAAEIVFPLGTGSYDADRLTCGEFSVVARVHSS